MGPLGDGGLSIVQLAYAETLRLLGVRVGELVAGIFGLVGLVAGMAYLALTFRLTSVMRRIRRL